ncbi:MAG: tRNA lysidine(34) synthetase TilS [Piscirickettsiaceae bacterium]|nr:tRNA lysidine(34) synthetase TilS [Piscirickettsiaceae bacterium]
MLNQQQILNDLVKSTTGGRIWLAYSGGVDSHVLLHLLATANHPHLNFIATIYVNHNLQYESKKWAKHCSDICLGLEIKHYNLDIKVENIDILGIEAAARAMRYRSIEQLLIRGDILLTAQHQHDQAETLLLQLLRGAGPKGLSSMAKQSLIGDIRLLRPLLHTSHTDIMLYAQQHKLQWIEDPSNLDIHRNRSYIRNKIWPMIEKRWPQAGEIIGRAAQHCAEANKLLEELAEHDMNLLEFNKISDTLPISRLLTLSSSRQRNLLRYYIKYRQYPLPSTKVLQSIIDQVCLASKDGEPLVNWADVEVRRYKDQLYLMNPLKPHDISQLVFVQGTNDLVLQSDKMLTWSKLMGIGLTKSIVSKELHIGFRQGGEFMKLHGHNHHQSLKNLFQIWKIPPWLRNRIPLIFYNSDLIAVVGYGVCDKFAVSKCQEGFLPIIDKIQTN